MELGNCEKQNYGINKDYWPCLLKRSRVSATLKGEEDDGRNLRDYLEYQLVSVWREETVNVRLLQCQKMDMDLNKFWLFLWNR